MPTLFHFSDEPGITVFHPRPPLAHPEADALVWAIDEWHSPIYHVPRECPRVTFWRLPTSSREDVDRWMMDPAARMVICIEAAWLERLATAKLYRYLMPSDGFVADDDGYGAHRCEEPVQPIGMEELADLPRRIVDLGAELRICQSLAPIGRAIQSSTLHWSLIRMRNAEGWEGAP